MNGSPLKTRLSDAMKEAMRARDKARLGAVRLILADIQRIEVDERCTLDDTRILAVLDKMVKQRRDAKQQYVQAKRPDLAAQEQFELDLIAEFLPAALSPAELDTLISGAISTSGAESVRDMGKVMAILKPQVQGRADMGAVSQRIKTLLAG